MWVEELPNGKFKYFERYKDPLTEKWKKVSITLEKCSRQAEKKAQAYLQEKIDKKLSSKVDKNITYGQLKKEYLDQWLPTVKDSTIRNNLNYDRHLQGVLSDDVYIKNITKKTVRDIITKLSKKNNYPIVHKCRKRLHAILNYAVEMDYLQSNKSDNVLVPKPVETYEKEKVSFLAQEEIISLANDMQEKGDGLVRDVILFMFLTGIRYGEAAALEFEKVDFSNNTILVNATYDFNTKKLTTVKTTGSNRTISVSDNIIEIINKQKSRHKELGIETDFIFTTNSGTPLMNSYINKVLKRYMPDKKLTTHIFRHSHISFLAEKGVPLKAIMDRVGHTDPDTTLKIYSHTTINMQDYIDKQTELISI